MTYSPSPAAVTDTDPVTGESWALDIFEYLNDPNAGGERVFQMALFYKPVGGAWATGHGCFDLEISNPGDFAFPGKDPEMINFPDMIDKYGALNVVNAFLPSVRAWLANRYPQGGTATTPADQRATDARQMVASAIYTLKAGVDHVSVVSK